MAMNPPELAIHHPAAQAIGRRSILQPLVILLVAASMLAATQGISTASFRLADPITQALRGLDPAGSYLRITLHHIFQAAAALIIILLIGRVTGLSLDAFGFNTRHWRLSVKWVLRFSAGWLIFQGAFGLIMVLTGSTLQAFSFPLTAGNFAGYFLFQVLMSGTSEEILFRSMIMVPMVYLMTRMGYSEKRSFLVAAAAATLIFILGHVSYSFNPWRVSYNPLQLLTCLAFGSFYAFLFIRTRSLVGPILAHNLLNGVIVLIGLVLYLVFA